MNLILQTNARLLRDLHRRIHETWRERNVSPKHAAAWEEAAREFHRRYDELAFPGGLEREFNLLQTGDLQAATLALFYLENRPFCFRSQYVATALRRALNKIAPQLPEPMRERFITYKVQAAARKLARRSRAAGTVHSSKPNRASANAAAEKG